MSMDLDLLGRTFKIGGDDLKVFAAQVERTGLDPFGRQIYAVPRGGRMTIQVSIDGFRLVAERTGKYAGQDGPFWCGEDGQWTDIWTDSQAPVAAKVVVKKVMGNLVAPTPAVAHFSEYNAGGQFWKSKPALMIAKCAEALALRKAFPQELSGLYTAEEMDQADTPADPTIAEVTTELGAKPSDPQIKYLKSLLTKSKATADDIRLLYLEVTGRELPKGRKFQDEVTRDECSRAIERLKEGAIPTAANPDLPPPAEGEFVHEAVSAEDFIEAFPGTVEEPAA